MTDNVRLGLAATIVIVLHGAVVLMVLAPRAPTPAWTPQTTWIGLSTSVAEMPRTEGARPRHSAPGITPPSPTDSPTPAAPPGDADDLDTPPRTPLPGEPVPSPQEEPAPPVSPSVQTPPKVPAQEVLARLIYPTQALRRRLEATVVLDLLVSEAGVVTPLVVEDPGHGFAEAAVRALEGLVVTPARVDGNPVASRLRYPVRFVLP